jgi:hypothetical protein
MITSAVVRWTGVSLGLFALVGCSAGGDDGTTASAALEDSSSVVLRQTSLYSGGCQGCTRRMAVVMTTGRYFQEKVGVRYRRGSGEWVEQQGSFLREIDDRRALWLVNDLPPESPFVFAVHYQAFTSGGFGLDFWDNNGGGNYAVAGDGALGPGIDIAAASVSMRDASWSAKLVVRNLSAQKAVSAVYSTDEWRTTQTAIAHFDHGDGDGTAEVWTVDGSIASGTSVEFAFEAQQAGRSSWDNDFGTNYRCVHDSIVGWSCGSR